MHTSTNYSINICHIELLEAAAAGATGEHLCIVSFFSGKGTQLRWFVNNKNGLNII